MARHSRIPLKKKAVKDRDPVPGHFGPPLPPPPSQDSPGATDAATDEPDAGKLHLAFDFDFMPFLGTKIEQGRKAFVLKALVRSMGVVTPALAATGVNRTVFSLWKKDDEVFAKAVSYVEDVALDFAETALFKKIQGGDTPAILFYLRTKGRGRGYDDRQRVVETPTGETFSPVDFVPLADLKRELPESSLDRTLDILAEVLPRRETIAPDVA